MRSSIRSRFATKCASTDALARSTGKRLTILGTRQPQEKKRSRSDRADTYIIHCGAWRTHPLYPLLSGRSALSSRHGLGADASLTRFAAERTVRVSGERRTDALRLIRHQPDTRVTQSLSMQNRGWRASATRKRDRGPSLPRTVHGTESKTNQLLLPRPRGSQRAQNEHEQPHSLKQRIRFLVRRGLESKELFFA